jgi:hypothetical protein
MQRDSEARERLISTGSLKSVLSLINPTVGQAKGMTMGLCRCAHTSHDQPQGVMNKV